MTTFRLAAIAAITLAALGTASAETKTFIIDSADGYGIDHCLASGEACGKAMATALCKSHQFVSAVDFGRMDPTEITGSLPAGLKAKTCQGSNCPAKVAITCTR